MCTSLKSDAQCYVYTFLIGQAIFDEWLGKDYFRDGLYGVVNNPPPSSLTYPKLHLSAALHPKYPMKIAKPGVDGKQSEAMLAYVLVVQGSEGAVTRKVIVCHDLHAAGDALTFEGLNGYSVVFSCAILQKAATALTTLNKDRLRWRGSTINFIHVQMSAARNDSGHPVWVSRVTTVTKIPQNFGIVDIGFVH